jgi:hypothetical protein
MTTAAASKPEVFTRKASGLVRVMSPFSAFIYNVLTMGLIFPWTYLWAPGALPGGKMVWGILLAMVIEIPIALVYVWLSTALPRSGGDYVFQSRVFGGGVAFTVVMSGYVIWILQWVALSGWLLSYLGFAPLFLGLGATTGSTALSSLGIVVHVIDWHRNHQYFERFCRYDDLDQWFQELRTLPNCDDHWYPDCFLDHVDRALHGKSRLLYGQDRHVCRSDIRYTEFCANRHCRFNRSRGRSEPTL